MHSSTHAYVLCSVNTSQSRPQVWPGIRGTRLPIPVQHIRPRSNVLPQICQPMIQKAQNHEGGNLPDSSCSQNSNSAANNSQHAGQQSGNTNAAVLQHSNRQTALQPNGSAVILGAAVIITAVLAARKLLSPWLQSSRALETDSDQDASQNYVQSFRKGLWKRMKAVLNTLAERGLLYLVQWLLTASGVNAICLQLLDGGASALAPGQMAEARHQHTMGRQQVVVSDSTSASTVDCASVYTDPYAT